MIKPNDPLSVVIEFLRVIQDLLLLMDMKGNEMEIVNVLIKKNLITDFAFRNLLNKIFHQVSLDELINHFLNNDSTGYLSVLKMKLISEPTNNLLDVLATKNEMVSTQFMSIICQRIDDRLMYFENQIKMKGSQFIKDDSEKLSKDSHKRDLLMGLSLFKEYLSSPSLKKDLLNLDPTLLQDDRRRAISRYSNEVYKVLNQMKPIATKSSKNESKPVLKKKKKSINIKRSLPISKKRKN